ncbi:MAG TPA: LacI family DNA-binding transcriptional regulator [Chthonomonadaceae bacterium]|nr:LacI family DNA-binding transcriptional regulator [Chthonomonadaceae bacterium]
MRQFRKATIKEVAARSGVSTTTVSDFLSGRKNACSPETAERIRQAVSALHYTPSSLTRGLRHRTTTTIGVCLLNPLDPDVAFGFFFLERLWRGIMKQADDENYSLLHYPHSVRDSTSCAAFLDGRIDGLLLHAHDNARAVPLAAAGMPTVLLTRSLQLPEGCGAVWADEAQTVRLALEHLWSLGHRRIAHVAGPVGAQETSGLPADENTGREDIALRRLEGYCAWMRERQRHDPALIAYAQAWAAPQAAQYLQVWRSLAQPPTAVFCANDAQARDIIAAAQRMGWRVPEELSVVGVDNSHEARDCDPPLTSVEVPIDAVGREALRALLRLIQGAPLEQCRVALPVTDLIVRRSTAVCRAS